MRSGREPQNRLSCWQVKYLRRGEWIVEVASRWGSAGADLVGHDAEAGSARVRRNWIRVDGRALSSQVATSDLQSGAKKLTHHDADKAGRDTRVAIWRCHRPAISGNQAEGSERPSSS